MPILELIIVLIYGYFYFWYITIPATIVVWVWVAAQKKKPTPISRVVSSPLPVVVRPRQEPVQTVYREPYVVPYVPKPRKRRRSRRPPSDPFNLSSSPK